MKWLVFGIGAVVLGFLVLVYEFSGIRYYWEMSDFVRSRKIEEKVAMEREVFGSDSELTYGGVFLRATDKGIWMWGRGGPRFFTKENGISAYYFFDICSQENIKLDLQSKNMSTIREFFSDFNIWQKKLKKGKYIFVRYDRNNPKAMKEVWGYGGWYFLDRNLSQQCAI